jgi:hypothetical protein
MAPSHAVESFEKSFMSDVADASCIYTHLRNTRLVSAPPSITGGCHARWPTKEASILCCRRHSRVLFAPFWTELAFGIAARFGSCDEYVPALILGSVVGGRCCGYSTERETGGAASISRRCDDSDVLITSRAKPCMPVLSSKIIYEMHVYRIPNNFVTVFSVAG